MASTGKAEGKDIVIPLGEGNSMTMEQLNSACDALQKVVMRGDSTQKASTAPVPPGHMPGQEKKDDSSEESKVKDVGDEMNILPSGGEGKEGFGPIPGCVVQ